MKRQMIALGMLLLLICGGHRVMAQADYGYFNSLGLGLSVSTVGVGLEVSTPIGNYLALRGGVSFMPKFTVTDEVNADLKGVPQGYPQSAEVELEGSTKRTTGELLLNLYPFRSNGFFVAAGASFGGDKFVQITGHSDELQQLIAAGGSAGLQIGDVSIPVDQNGNVSGGLKVSAVRPYVGLGYGRAVPSKRINFMLDAGVQLHGTPEVYSDFGQVDQLMAEVDNDFTDIINKLKVYPVIRFRICGKLF
ncbi:MAG: hypothetical protein SPE11_13075 [Parabacteroides sp.]|nr:hypothetical protein [bacterium]MDY4102296.1 hypothetical protein [Parabacteroides sp.]MDD6765530.1 hypothetical protein [bacterium]MDD6836523.1 hypothetical protein [bacterium]MDD7632040.1 hypothetical protein [bacterium]